MTRLFKISRSWCEAVYWDMLMWDGTVMVELDGVSLEGFIGKLNRFNAKSGLDFFPRFF